MIYRSQGGEHDPANVVTLCKAKCHDDVHVRAVLRVSGDADARDGAGRFVGVKIERWVDGGGWRVDGWR
jgi:hypothetical protein